MTHGRPSPKKIFTELDPVTFPTAESAYSDPCAAVTDAKVSGTEVPRATSVMAVIAGGILNTHPKSSATSPTMAVMAPTNPRAMKKAGKPPPVLTGGMIAKNIFQVIKRKCMIASDNEGAAIIRSSSSTVGPSKTAYLNWPFHVGSTLSKKYYNNTFSLTNSFSAPLSYIMVTMQTFLDEILKFSEPDLDRITLNIFSVISSSSSSGAGAVYSPSIPPSLLRSVIYIV